MKQVCLNLFVFMFILGCGNQQTRIPPNSFPQTKSYDELLSKAEEGDAESQYIFGMNYYYGHGTQQDYKEQDYRKAAEWYEKSSKQGYAKAQSELGVMYLDGNGVKRDYKTAADLLTKAAMQGDVKAQYNLGYIYEHGYGVKKDAAAAVKWYRKAAEQGHLFAQNNLGAMYHSGRGVEQDFAEAAKWYRKAAEQADAQAQYNLAELYYLGQGVAQKTYHHLE